MSIKITLKEIKEVIQDNKIQPQDLFTKETLLSDPTIELLIQKKIEERTDPERDKLKLDETDDEKKRREEEEKKAAEELKAEEEKKKEDDDLEDLIPDIEPKGKQEEEDELIPD